MSSPTESRAERLERIRARVRTLPVEPGCYLFKDRKGEIFYVGKAQLLRNRVRGYFSGADTRQFVAWLDDLLFDIEFIVVRNEKEALLLERTLVRQHKPRFNVLLQDDKNFIHLRLDTRAHQGDAKPRLRYPRLAVVRGPKRDGARYFGPYHSATAVRQTLRIVNRHFQLRTCTDAALETRTRPCLQFQIGRCPAPCVQPVDDYRDHVQDAALFLSGRGVELERRLADRMWTAAQSESFELAAHLRDQLQAVRSSRTTQVVTEVSKRKNQDIVALARLGSSIEIARVVVRAGGMRSADTFAFERQEFPSEELLASFLSQLYHQLDDKDLPDEVLTSLELDRDATQLAVHLGERRGRRVDVRRPARGHLRQLLAIAQKNADTALAERLRKDETRQRGLERLQKRLRLSRVPRVIECFDISIFQGTDAVASQVTFVDGVPEKSLYRRYNIKTVEGTDDFMSLFEAITRRLKRGVAQGDLPDLLMVDGGKGQLKVALAAAEDLGVRVGPGALHIAAIAKSRNLDDAAMRGETKGLAPEDLEGGERKKTPERVFVPNAKDPIVLRPHTDERYLVERVRDEAHRFAITGHRRRRKKRTLRSQLDEIPGVGPKKRAAIIRALGSAKAAAAASEDELASVPGVGKKLAKTIRAAFKN